MDSHLSAGTDEPSFVILQQESMQPEPQMYLPSCTFSTTSDFVIQRRLDQLIVENQELREALAQNNLAMKTQFDTLASWQEEVLKTHQSHKEKFSETRDLVFKLRDENASLKMELESLSKSVTREGASSHESLVDSLKFELAAEVEKSAQLEAEKFVLIKERDAFREECTRLNLKITNLESLLVQKTEELSSFRLPSNVCQIEPQIGESWLDLSALSMGPATLVGESSTRKFATCQNTQLMKEKYNSADHMKELEEQREKLEILSKDHVQLTVCLKKSECEKENLEEELQSKDKLLKVAVQELNEARSKIQELLNRNEELAVFQAQAEAYQKDFEEERDARQKLVGEKEELREEIRRLQALQTRANAEGISSPAVASVGSQAQQTRANAEAISSSDITSTQSEPTYDDSAEVTSTNSEEVLDCPICNERVVSNCALHFESCFQKAAFEMVEPID